MTVDRGRLRVFFLMLAAASLAGVLTARLVYWQLLQGHSMALLAARQHQATVKLPASRGRVLDRNGQPLAFDTPVYNIFAAPDQIPDADKAATADRLAPALGMTSDEVLAHLRLRVQFQYLKRRVDKDTADRIQAMHLLGIAREAEVQRTYIPSQDGAASSPVPAPAPSPAGVTRPVAAGAAPVPGGPVSLASNLLGFVNFEGRALYGIEQKYDHLLQGRDGLESSVRDGANQAIVLSDRKRVEPVNGSDLLLSIDSQVQYIAEKALRAGVERTRAESGSVIVMEPRTGNVVAWADYPSFDANHFDTADPALFSDHVVSRLYEPGSVMKVVTLSGALDDGAITPGYSFDERGGISVGGSYIRDWDLKAHGHVDMTYVLAHSLNVGAILAQQLEGPQKYYDYLDRFGFGHPTGVDVANEVSAPVRPLASARPNEVATMTFGQGIAVTPIEMISAVNAVANGGTWVRPRVATATIDHGPNGAAATRPREFAPDLGHRVVAAATAEEMKQMMIAVVERGSGWTVQMPGWKGLIAGKTGTANVPEGGRYTDKTIASFVGFMPAANPRFTMLVVMRKPQGDALQQEGTFAAAPTWKDIAQQILLQWQITP